MKRILILAWLLLTVTALPTQAEFALDIGSGLDIPLESEMRDAYGTGIAMGLGASASLSPLVRVFVDASLVRTTGQELEEDPTFQVDDARFLILPLTVGFRREVAAGSEGRVRLHLGAGWRTVFTFWRDPFGETENEPTIGVVGELRPELLLSDRWSVWVRQRVSLLGDINFASGADRNVSSSTLEFGLTFATESR